MDADDSAPETPTYVDRLGRTWALEFTYANARLICSELKLDFVNAHDGKALKAICEDDHLLVRVLELLCAPRMEELGVAADDWAAGVDGATLGRALEALGEAVVNFSQPARRPVLRAILDRAAEMQTAASQSAAERVRGAKMDKLLQRALEKADQKLTQALQQFETSGNWPTTSGPSST